jgi:WD40 repeat protein
MVRRWNVILLAGLLLTACGGSSTTVSLHSPSTSAGSSPGAGGETPAPFPTPSPASSGAPPASAHCTAPPAAGEQLGLVSLRGVPGVVVRDITDIGHPTTRCTITGGSQFQFVSATKVSYIVLASSNLGAAGALYVFDAATGSTSLVRSWAYTGFAATVYAWSPDGSRLAYLNSDTTGLTWHVLSAAGDRVLANLGTVPSRGVSADNDDAMTGFSADGQYVAMEQTFAGTTRIQVNHVSDYTIAYSRNEGTMAAWAGTGAKLYFRTASGVMSWDPSGGVATAVSGLVWIRPHASPDGSRIAFSVLNAQQNHVGQVLDLATNTVGSMSPNPRVGAAFLNASLVWYAGETPCTTASPCGLGGPPLSGQTYIYDLSGGVETGSIDTAYYDAWPHAVGQS